MFLPSGTMCNQIALLVHCRPGDEVIAADVAHIFTSEAGGGSALAGAQTWPLATKRGIFTAAAVDAAVRDVNRHSPRSRLLAVEQTVNRAGGAIWPLEAIEEVAGAARRHGLAMHMDGARILNAVVASGVAAQRMAAPCDSVWLDLSKGLGCPVGGVLAGSKAFIDEAWRWKHRLGGALRQSGMLAAAGLYALDHNVERLAEDHGNARRLAEMLGNLAGIRIMNPEVETNIVFIDPTPERAEAQGHRRRAAAPQRAHGHLLRRHDPRRHPPRRHARRHGDRGAGLQGRGERRARLSQAKSARRVLNYEMPSHPAMLRRFGES